ncbi:MAG: tetratricopeptide repeat protein [Cuspidothrix sp.]
MLETFPTANIVAITIVIFGLAILGYLSIKTLITSNLFQKAINFYQAKDYENAEIVLRKVIAINSTNDMVRLLLGDILNQKGQIEEAKALFCEVIDSSPKNPDAYLRLATILMQEQQPEAVKANLIQAKELLQKQRQPERAKKVGLLLDKMSKQ